MKNPTTIQIAGEELTLLPEKVIFWKRENLLLVADLHLGKTATFRASGIAVPEGGTKEDLAVLDRCVVFTGAAGVIILGDLLHAADGRTSTVGDCFLEWRRRHPDLDVVLVTGNHDQSAGPPPLAWRVSVSGSDYLRPPFVFRHDPQPDERGFVLAGHLHPAIRLAEGKLSSRRIPCFHFSEGVGVLPAFGSFTGTHRIDERPGDRVFAIADGEVLEIPSVLLA